MHKILFVLLLVTIFPLSIIGMDRREMDRDEQQEVAHLIGKKSLNQNDVAYCSEIKKRNQRGTPPHKINGRSIDRTIGARNSLVTHLKLAVHLTMLNSDTRYPLNRRIQLITENPDVLWSLYECIKQGVRRSLYSKKIILLDNEIGFLIQKVFCNKSPEALRSLYCKHALMEIPDDKFVALLSPEKNDSDETDSENEIIAAGMLCSFTNQ